LILHQMLSTHRFLLRLLWRSGGVALCIILLVIAATAQTSSTDGTTLPGQAPGSPAGSYGLSGFDTVNLYNGNLNVTLPLLGVGGRGGAQTSMVLANLNTHWTVEYTPPDIPSQLPAAYDPNPEWWTFI